MPAQQGSAYPFPSQRVVVLRHGERRDSHPDAPAEANPPLTEAGVAAIKTTAARLKHYLGEEAARGAVLVVSPFLRTVQTAESLQHHGVGSETAMVIDNTLCEVFGPSRIKTSRAPQLQPSSSSRAAVGGLPVWGESIETATERYVTNFLRNGDVYGGYLCGESSLSTPSFVNRQESQTSSMMVCPAAVTNRLTSAAPPSSPDSALMSSMKGGPPRDVILVTHGDAISSVVSHFYPARVVYEADFLSFIIMRRYGVGNHVYHLDESAGVNWFVEGIDCEPPDPILYALEMERAKATAASNGNGTNGNASVEEDEFDDDDEGEALDDDADDQPASFAGSRMKSRTSRLPARNVHNHTSDGAKPAGLALPVTQVHTPVLGTPQQPPAVHARHANGGAGGGGGGSGGPGGGINRQPHGAAAHAARSHPKAGEDCERIRMPTGTPAQSSSNPVSPTTGNNGEATTTSTQALPSQSRDESRSTMREKERGVKESEEQAEEEGEEEDHEEACAEGSAYVMREPAAAKPMTTFSMRGMSSYAGLSEEASTNTWLASQATSTNLFSTFANARAVSSVAVAASAVRRSPPLPPTPPLTPPSVQPAPTPPPPTPPVPSSFASAATAQMTSRQSSAIASPPNAVPLSSSNNNGPPYNSYGAIPPKREFDNSIGANATNPAASPAVPAQHSVSSALAVPPTPSGIGDGDSVAAAHLARRIDRHRVLNKATSVSYVLRFACALLLVVSTIVLQSRGSLVWCCMLGVVWELVAMVVLTLSCRADRLRLRCVRRAMEQLRCGPLLLRRSGSATASSSGSNSRSAGQDAFQPHDDASSDTPFYPFQDAPRGAGFYESSMEWQGGVGSSSAGGGAAVAASDGASLGSAPAERRSVPSVVVLCLRHVAATALKVALIDFGGVLGSMMSSTPPQRALSTLGHLYDSAPGLPLTLVYCAANLARGVWDEVGIDSILDHR